MMGSGVSSGSWMFASAGGGWSSGFAITAARTAVAAVVAATTATSLLDSVALGPRFTGVGVLLPTVFLGLVVLGVAGLGVLDASLEEVALLSGFGRIGVFESAALLDVGFFVAVPDLAVDFGTSCLVGFGAGLVRA